MKIMSDEKTLQTQNSQPTLLKAKLQKTLDLSKSIIDGRENMPYLEMNLTISDNLEKPLMRSVFTKELGMVGFSVCQTIITRFVDSFGFGTKLNTSQLETLTVDTVEHFSYESLEDIILFFKYCRQGRYGDTHKGLDSNLIFGKWFPMYMEEKAIAREIKKLEGKKQINKTENLKAVEFTYEQIERKKEDQKQMDHIDSITRDFSRDDLEALIVKYEINDIMKKYVPYLKRKRRHIKD